MSHPRLNIRLDLASGDRIGPGKITLLEAIRSTGSISGAARKIGMSYRRAWLLVEEINKSLRSPAVEAAIGGKQGGGASITDVGEKIIEIYHSIHSIAASSVQKECQEMERLTRKARRKNT